MVRRPTRCTRTHTLCPYTTIFRSYPSPFGGRSERYGFGPAPRRFRAQLRIDYADGSREWVATGPDWMIAPSPILKSELYDGETSDARAEHPGWDRPGRSEERRVGKECGSTCRSRWSPSP